MQVIFKEAILVGIVTLIIGQLVGFSISKFMKNGYSVRSECKNWNKNHIMELSLFFTGVIIHLLLEYLGINKLYCKHGNACKL